jgi:hypothetical protein
MTVESEEAEDRTLPVYHLPEGSPARGSASLHVSASLYGLRESNRLRLGACARSGNWSSYWDDHCER